MSCIGLVFSRHRGCRRFIPAIETIVGASSGRSSNRSIEFNKTAGISARKFSSIGIPTQVVTITRVLIDNDARTICENGNGLCSRGSKARVVLHSRSYIHCRCAGQIIRLIRFRIITAFQFLLEVLNGISSISIGCPLSHTSQTIQRHRTRYGRIPSIEGVTLTSRISRSGNSCVVVLRDGSYSRTTVAIERDGVLVDAILSSYYQVCGNSIECLVPTGKVITITTRIARSRSSRVPVYRLLLQLSTIMIFERYSEGLDAILSSYYQVCGNSIEFLIPTGKVITITARIARCRSCRVPVYRLLLQLSTIMIFECNRISIKLAGEDGLDIRHISRYIIRNIRPRTECIGILRRRGCRSSRYGCSVDSNSVIANRNSCIIRNTRYIRRRYRTITIRSCSNIQSVSSRGLSKLCRIGSLTGYRCKRRRPRVIELITMFSSRSLGRSRSTRICRRSTIFHIGSRQGITIPIQPSNRIRTFGFTIGGGIGLRAFHLRESSRSPTGEDISPFGILLVKAGSGRTIVRRHSVILQLRPVEHRLAVLVHEGDTIFLCGLGKLRYVCLVTLDLSKAVAACAIQFPTTEVKRICTVVRLVGLEIRRSNCCFVGRSSRSSIIIHLCCSQYRHVVIEECDIILTCLGRILCYIGCCTTADSCNCRRPCIIELIGILRRSCFFYNSFVGRYRTSIPQFGFQHRTVIILEGNKRLIVLLIEVCDEGGVGGYNRQLFIVKNRWIAANCPSVPSPHIIRRR